PGDVAAQATPEQKAQLVTKEKKTKKKKEEEEDKPEEWDGTIDEDNISREATEDSNIAEWNSTTDDTNYPQIISLVSADYVPFPEQDDPDVVTIFRWASRDGDTGDLGDQGDWTADENEARSAGRRYAEEHDEPKVESEPEEEEESDGEEEDEEEYPDEAEEEESTSDPPPKFDKQLKADKSHAKVVLQADEEEATAFLTKLFPQAADVREELASAVGAPDDAVVKVTHVGPYKKLFSDDTPSPGAVGMRIWVDHPKLG